MFYQNFTNILRNLKIEPTLIAFKFCKKWKLWSFCSSNCFHLGWDQTFYPPIWWQLSFSPMISRHLTRQKIFLVFEPWGKSFFFSNKKDHFDQTTNEDLECTWVLNTFTLLIFNNFENFQLIYNASEQQSKTFLFNVQWHRSFCKQTFKYNT